MASSSTKHHRPIKCSRTLCGAFVFLFLLNIFLLLFPLTPFAQDQGSDRYNPIFPERAASSLFKEIAKHFLVYPFELVRWPIDQGLYFTDRYHIDKKAKWIYDKVSEQGITPFGNVFSITSFGGGFDIDFVKMARQRTEHPDWVAEGKLLYGRQLDFEVGSEVGLQHVAGTWFHALGDFKYENRPQEHFDGIGHLSSAGNGTSYRMEATTVGSLMGFGPSPSLSADFKFAYQNINITNGEDGGRGIIDTTFTPDSIPGLAGDELINLGFEFKHDTRNHGRSSTKGGEEKINFTYVDGIQHSNAQYLKYQIELSRYFRLWSDRRVFALHFYAEENNPFSHHTVPFHQMAKLGGYGDYPSLSHPLRGFDTNRFFDKSAALLNMEYRYTIWEHKDFKMDSIFFLDEGQVFTKFFKFKMSNFRESYGTGLRLNFANNVIFSFEVAHGDEGTNFYVKSSAPF